jgi:hypothetical protein
MIAKLYQSLTPARKKRVKVYGYLSLLFFIVYLSLFTFAISNQTLSSLSNLLSVFAGIGLILSIFTAIALFTLFVGDKDSGGGSNGVFLCFASISFYIPIFPLICLAYSGYRKNNSLFRILAGVITFLHTILFNQILLSLFDPLSAEEALFMPVYLLGFFSLLLILARFIKYLPVRTLEKLYMF